MKILELQQGTEKWLAERRKYNTASEAPIVKGASSKTSRSEMLRLKQSGLEQEHSQWVLEVLFPRGHEVEAAARPIAEQIVGEELYPAVAVSDEGDLMASYDGVTMLEDVVWECKQWNESKAEQVRNSICPDEDFWQVVQHAAVAVGARCLYMVTDGTEDKTVSCWVDVKPAAIQELRDSWAQFERDLLTYEAPEPEKPVTGSGPKDLPALNIELSGGVSASNLSKFRDKAVAVFDGIKTDLETDQDFADADATVKFCSDIEKRLKAAKEHALSQTQDIDQLFKTIDEINEQARSKRLELDKLVKAEKDRRKGEVVSSARSDYQSHVDALQQDLNSDSCWVISWAFEDIDVGGAIKGKSKINKMQDAADTAVANAKIEANKKSRQIRESLETLKAEAEGYESIFPDGGQLVVDNKSGALTELARGRIAQHKEQERRKEAERQAKADANAKQVARDHEMADSDANPAAPKSTQPPSGAVEPETKRPSDAQIVSAIAEAFGVDEATASDWIVGMNITAAA